MISSGNGSAPIMQMTLPDQVYVDSLNNKNLRDLPLPHHANWCTTENHLIASPCYEGNLVDPLRAHLTEIERFQTLPADIVEDEKARLHAFFFGEGPRV